MGDRDGPRKRPPGNPHAISSRHEPSLGVTRDLSARVEYLDVSEVTNTPASIDEAPAQFNLLVAVEELGEVATYRLICAPADRARPTQKVRYVAGHSSIHPPSAGHMSTGSLAILVDESKCDGAKARISIERSGNLLRQTSELSVVIEKPDEFLVAAPNPAVTSTWNTEVARYFQHTDIVTR
jgi:hypothetical protein